MRLNPKIFFTGFVLSLVLPAATLPAQDAPAQSADESNPIDPVAAEVVLNSTRYLSGLPTFSFSYFMTSDEVVGGREKITYVTSGVVEMERGSGFLVKSEREDTYRDFYFNGKEFTAASPDEQFYATVPFTGSYEELVGRVRANTGLVLPVWTMLTENLPDRLVEEVNAAAYLGTVLLAGQEVHHVAFSSQDEDWQMWISTNRDKPLPLMLVGTRTDLQGWPQFRANFMDWDVAPEIDASVFKFVPGENDSPITMPWLNDGSTDQEDLQEADDLAGQGG